MILPDSGVLKMALLKTILGVWWCAIALARLKRQGLGLNAQRHAWSQIVYMIAQFTVGCLICTKCSEINQVTKFTLKGQRYIASVCYIISLIELRKPFTQSKCINCIGIQNNILKKLFHTFIQTVILKLVMLNYG